MFFLFEKRFENYKKFIKRKIMVLYKKIETVNIDNEEDF